MFFKWRTTQFDGIQDDTLKQPHDIDATKSAHYYRPQRTCEGYVFTGVCVSTGGGGGIPACLAADLQERCAIPACIAGGIPACLATGLQGGAWSGGVCVCSWGVGGLPGLGGVCSQGGWHPPWERWVLLQTVCIPLECIHIVTRMHSSRMRTSRSLTVCQSLLPGGCLLWGGRLLWGVVSQHALRQTLPPVDRITDSCRNMTLAQLGSGR